MTETINKVDTFKKIMGEYPTGVTIVTTMNAQGIPVGLTVNSFASVSLDPLIVLWSIDKKVSSLSAFMEAEKFVVHTLATDQIDACWAFAGKEADRFSKVNWKVSENGLPVITDSLGILECKTIQQIDAGDHIILLGEVIEIKKEDKNPLLYYNRNIAPIPANWPEK